MIASPKVSPPAHFRRGASASRHQARRAGVVSALAAGLSGRALDYGAGWGDLTVRLAPQFSSIEGVDVAAERVSFAAAEYAPIPFHRCDPDGTDYPDASFDVVFSTVVLHFVPSAEDYLAECRRLLRPGGRLVMMIQNPESMWMLARRWRTGTTPRQSWGGSSLREFEQWLGGHGFTVEERAGFYDPPLDHLRRPGDLVIAAMNAVGHVCSIEDHWSYVGFRCRRSA